jgi:hypothetical protein
MTRRYMALQTELGWFLAVIGSAGLRVISDRLDVDTATGTANILNDVFTPDWTTEHVRTAYALVPYLWFPIWLPEWLRDRYDPVRIARRLRETPRDREIREKMAAVRAAKGEKRHDTI